MRHSIVVKFLAIMLCAACLLGIATSAGCIVMLMGTRLYSKTPERYREERIRESGEPIAMDMARWYCSEHLGSVREDVLNQFLGRHYYGGFDRRYTYLELTDAQGRVLSEKWEANVKGSPTARQYEFPVVGEYLHLLRMEPVQEPALEPETTQAQELSGGVPVYYNNVPEEGAWVYRLSFNTGTISCGYGAAEPIGRLHNNNDGSFLYEHTSNNLDNLTDGVIYSAEFVDEDGNAIFFASDAGGIGELVNTGNNRFWISLYHSEGRVGIQWARTTAAPGLIIGAGERGIKDNTALETQASQESLLSRESQGAPEATVETEGSLETVAEDEEFIEAQDAAQTLPTEESDWSEPEETLTLTYPEEREDGVLHPVQHTDEELIGGRPLSDFEIQTGIYTDGAQSYKIEFVWVPIEGMTVTLYAEPGAVVYDGFLQLSSVVYPYRNDLFLILGISGLLFAVFSVYLACAAGHKPKTTQIRAGGLNRLPLDLYLALLISAGVGITYLVVEGGDFLLRQSVRAGALYMMGIVYAASLAIVGFCYAIAAQVKTAGGYWWRNSVCFRSVMLLKKLVIVTGKLLVKIVKNLLPMLGKIAVLVWKGIAASTKTVWRWGSWSVTGLTNWGRKRLHRILRMLPLTWQWLLGGGAMALLLLMAVATGSKGFFILCLMAAAGLILYGANCYGTLMDSTRQMSKGNLDMKIDDHKMLGCFKDFAEDLNNLADVAVVAAQKQLKSERMKTELITNVSHDIKTPLTSIINYVDLLQKPHSQQEQEQYLEVLSRQSLRLKKLIDDLMDMSKASTGNMTAEFQALDAAEFINQALGEFCEKLERAQLIPVFRHGQEDIRILADGRLVWRVLSNILSNAVKYAMPGTRLYIDLSRAEGRAIISLKNISRDELNLNAEELLERFVRGDGSRNTEGSGLGLNIAKSLMELQKGQLQLLVDGDLFKVTLIFLEAE